MPAALDAAKGPVCRMSFKTFLQDYPYHLLAAAVTASVLVAGVIRFLL
jgi:hypothetical protein